MSRPNRGGGAIRFVEESSLVEGLSLESVKNLMIQKNPCAEKRAGWYFQQFLKMGFARKCKNDYYIIWDTDTIPLKRIDFFNENGEPCFHMKTEHHKPYFDTTMRLFGAGKISEKSFIAENMIVSVKVMNELLDEIEANENLCGKSFWEKIIDAVEPSQLPGSGFSEYETYGTFVMKNYPKMYGFADFHSYRNGKSLFGENPQKEQLEWISKKYVAVALERYHKKIPLIPLVLKTKFGRRLISVDSAEKFVWLWERFRGFRSRCMNFPKRIVRKVLKKS